MDGGATEANLLQELIRTVMFGQTVLKHKQTRFLGVQGLVLEFDTERRDAKGRRLGWALALMEMLVGPMLSAWVPAWVREQYERWNPFPGLVFAARCGGTRRGATPRPRTRSPFASTMASRP